jgi:hypothetical protein
MADEKIYCGSAKVIKTQHGELTKVSFHKEDINKIVKWMKDNSSDWANLVVKEKREPKEGKPTHYLEIDTWKPTKQPPEQPQVDNAKNDGLPF